MQQISILQVKLYILPVQAESVSCPHLVERLKGDLDLSTEAIAAVGFRPPRQDAILSFTG